MIGVAPVPQIGKKVSMASVIDPVRALIERLSPVSMRGACVTQRLNIAYTEQIDRDLSKLARPIAFNASTGNVLLCGAHRKIIHFRQR